MIQSKAPLKVTDLSVSYHDKPVLEHISFEVPEGKLIGIVGPNGAGKSTLIKSVLELVPRLKGEVTFWGQPYKRVQKENRIRTAAGVGGLGFSDECAGCGHDGALRPFGLVQAPR